MTTPREIHRETLHVDGRRYDFVQYAAVKDDWCWISEVCELIDGQEISRRRLRGVDTAQATEFGRRLIPILVQGVSPKPRQT